MAAELAVPSNLLRAARPLPDHSPTARATCQMPTDRPTDRDTVDRERGGADLTDVCVEFYICIAILSHGETERRNVAMPLPTVLLHNITEF